jgi:hypothetical protein
VLQAEVRDTQARTENLVKEELRLLALVAGLTATNIELRRLVREAQEGKRGGLEEKECVEVELEGVRENLTRLEKAEEEMAREAKKTRVGIGFTGHVNHALSDSTGRKQTIKSCSAKSGKGGAPGAERVRSGANKELGGGCEYISSFQGNA